jgi:nicotinate-nucleotide adenylyltransferase
MRLGIMGGTFDPIHYGHLFVAEEACARFGLNHVLFIPNGTPPHKKAYATTPAIHRFTMTRIATQDNPEFGCTSMELNRPGPSYAVETLKQLREERPDDELFYITGVDAVADILTWKRHEEVIRLATFIAATRPGFDPNTLEERLPLPYLQRILLLGSTALGISSTDIRQRIHENLPARYLTPDGVLEYIVQNGLYRNASIE